ncbi:MAG: hypothetical protein JO068_18595 [Hyphomicrobiales bacterium]|nr:hypothetical protein [Hyphomicrobiales bacterium]
MTARKRHSTKHGHRQMNGSRSNSSSLAPLRADTLFFILIGIFALIAGGLTAMVGGAIPWLFIRWRLSAVVLANSRDGIWLSVLLLPFASAYLVPRQVFGLTGLDSEIACSCFPVRRYWLMSSSISGAVSTYLQDSFAKPQPVGMDLGCR